ncbi:MAG: carbamoyltransferase C-terminal domain-containing protein [Fluviicola sp.]|nr:carbamoyltransferase C-terminal domain-containing protein [Fluviicola sp.]
MQQPIYVLGTGLSHNGSAVLLKDGKVCVAIEKERLTRLKHDGGNDSAAITYCLEAEGISLNDVAVVVQCANFEVPDRERFHGKRLFGNTEKPPLVSISHQLAHAYSAAGTCAFDTCNIMVIDGCGSPFDQCTDIAENTLLPDNINVHSSQQLWCEKDSFYHFDGQKVTALYKDFSPMVVGNGHAIRLSTTQHSIGGFYAAISHYVFGNLDDVGKLMGLAPYGKPDQFELEAFSMENGRLFVRDEWKTQLTRPSGSYDDFKTHFQYYANVAWWAQQQVEQAVTSCFTEHLNRFPHTNVCYSGGVALNAVANAQLLENNVVKNLYMEPAAGDNGLALGCAFYGWLEVLNQPKVPHDGNTCFGKTYTSEEIEQALHSVSFSHQKLSTETMITTTAQLLAEGKTVGWFQSGAEFGPRALGHRSILAHPSISGIGDHINANIKFREDFRPFAPATLPHSAATFFVSGRKSPYMILVDKTRPEYLERLKNVTHVNGTARVQTVDQRWNPEFYKLIETFGQITGIPVLLNTSFNKKGMPIVETPPEALALFAESALDVLVMGNYIIQKP